MFGSGSLLIAICNHYSTLIIAANFDKCFKQVEYFTDYIIELEGFLGSLHEGNEFSFSG
jgi:hypothetical protein